MATLDSKYIDVGTWQQQFELTPSYGFLASISQGEISDTPDGPQIANFLFLVILMSFKSVGRQIFLIQV